MSISNTPLNPPFPFMQDEAQSTPERYLPMPTAASLKQTSLFGIPLKSALTGETVADSTLEGYITKAISEIEHTLNIFITPVSFHERHDYDKELWTQQNAWLKLNNSPILDVQKVNLSFGNSSPLPPMVEFPLEFVYVNSQEGAIRLVPVLGTPIAGFTMSAFAGAQLQALMAIGAFQFPGAVEIKYRAGFEPNKIPAVFVSLMEKMAGLQVLSMLGPLLFPYSSVGIGIDGVSQSVGTPGPAFLANRINDLKEQIASEMESVKGYYLKRFIIDYI
jgi:hypothetical protein